MCNVCQTDLIFDCGNSFFREGAHLHNWDPCFAELFEQALTNTVTHTNTRQTGPDKHSDTYTHVKQALTNTVTHTHTCTTQLGIDITFHRFNVIIWNL